MTTQRKYVAQYRSQRQYPAARQTEHSTRCRWIGQGWARCSHHEVRQGPARTCARVQTRKRHAQRRVDNTTVRRLHHKFILQATRGALQLSETGVTLTALRRSQYASLRRAALLKRTCCFSPHRHVTTTKTHTQFSPPSTHHGGVKRVSGGSRWTDARLRRKPRGELLGRNAASGRGRSTVAFHRQLGWLGFPTAGLKRPV